VGVTGYKVSRDGTVVGTVTTTSYPDSGLAPNTAYSYSVVAVDAATNASTPATLTVTTSAAADNQAPTAPGSLSFTNVTSNSVTVNWAAATDNVGVTGYRISRDGAVLTTVTGLTFTDSPLTPSTTYAYSVVALDAANNASSPSAASIATAAGGGGSLPTIRVNAGGAAYVDAASNTWSADTGFNTGKSSNEPGTVVGTPDPTLYKTVRFDEATSPELQYAFTVPNGSYTVRLYFAETASSGTGTGKRVFNIDIQNQRAFDNVDIYTQAGGAFKALMLEKTAVVSGGQLQIRFLHKVNNPRINAIEIIPQ
jgi:chitodextrinase